MSNVDYIEKSVLLRLQEGDEKAFEEIYLRYKKSIIINAYRLLKSHDLVEEVVQDVFTKIWINRSKIDPEQKFQAYLNTVVRNHVIDLFRKMKRDQSLKEQLLLAVTESYDHIEPLLLAQENKKLLFNVLEKLPPLQREIFIMFKIEQKSYKELMEHFGITKSAINSHIYRSNIFLKNYVMKHHKDELLFIFLLSLFTLK